MPPAKIMMRPSLLAWIRLAVLGEVLGRDVKRPRGVRLLDRDVDRADPRVVHADVGDEVAAGVGDGDVHGLTDGSGFLLSGGDDAAGVSEGDHGNLSKMGVLNVASVPQRDDRASDRAPRVHYTPA